MLAPALTAQSQPTFYSAWEDGREAERQGQWRAALGAYQRAVALHPAPAAQVLIYGNNLLRDYFPYTRMARCHLELGEIERAESWLAQAEHFKEPTQGRQELAKRIADLKAAQAPPASKPIKPLPEPVNRPVAQPHSTPTAPPPIPPPEVHSPSLPVEPMASLPPSKEQVEKKPVPVIPSDAKPNPSQTRDARASAVIPTEQPAMPLPEKRPSRSPLWWAIPAGFTVLAGLGFLVRRRKQIPIADPSQSSQMGPYRVERLLGRGGFASTYLARHETTGEAVALKALHPYRQDDPEFLARFHQEARLGSRLNHPSLVRIVDPGPDSGDAWLAMEYVEGRRLDQRLKEGPLPLAETLRIAEAVASAMAYAHTQGVVHRDLKPGNIILSGAHVKIMDFGIARIVDSETLTTTYAFLGTPLYAAPEAQMKTQVGAAADAYSFGILLYEMLTGAPPFTGETPFEILDQHRSRPLPDLMAVNPAVPAPLAALVERLCRKAPSERPSDEETLEVLRRVMETNRTASAAH